MCFPQDTQESEFKKFLMCIHACNVEEMQFYNVAVIYDEQTEVNVLAVMEEKMHCVQKAYFYDTREQKPQGILCG